MTPTGGAGGGGYFGGGGGAVTGGTDPTTGDIWSGQCTIVVGAGGGGSAYAGPGTTDVSMSTGARGWHGYVVIRYALGG